MSAPDVVTAAFPYDGPHTPESVAAAADAVDGLLRYLANATRSRGALAAGPDIGAVLANLSAAAHKLPQILQQLAVAAERVSAAPDLYDDQGEDAVHVAARVAVACEDARAVAHDLAARLDEAHQFASRLGHR